MGVSLCFGDVGHAPHFMGIGDVKKEEEEEAPGREFLVVRWGNRCRV